MNLATIIEGHPDDAPALVSRGHVTTYAELRRQVGELRGGLTRLGVAPGDRVAIASANNWLFAVSYLAALGAGAVAVPVNPTSPPAELQSQLAAIEAKVLVVGPGARAAASGLDRGALALEAVLVTEGVDLAGATQLNDLFGGDSTAVVDRADDDLAVLLFTAGTSGAPKAAMLNHGNLLANIAQVQSHPGRHVTADDVALGVLPLFHVFGLNVVLGLMLSAGASVVLVERFDPASALDTIRDRKVTLVSGAPPMYAAWAAIDGADPDTFATVRLATSGAAPLSDEVSRTFTQRFSVPIRQGYGLTEAAPVVTSALPEGPEKPTSIGVPLPGVDVRLVDEQGDDTFAGDPGEIWVRGPNVFPGYWRNDEATRNALTPDGWLRTGDIAVVDDDGWLYIVDRAKDLIIVSGFNVYPAEVEDVLLEHPGVAAVAVVGVAHPHSGETVKAFVVAEGGRLVDEDELIDFCATRLARYKCPTKVMFVESLPQGVAGKVLRRALR
ncbi:MAG: long-chain acyl-CoA synthetase [Actinomycetota bacterium]|jgi:long-chain acyl-CoA synthetase